MRYRPKLNRVSSNPGSLGFARYASSLWGVGIASSEALDEPRWTTNPVEERP